VCAGCFDLEEQAARAYDKMMIWCDLHKATGAKGGITNYDHSEYEGEMEYLRNVSQVGWGRGHGDGVGMVHLCDVARVERAGLVRGWTRDWR